MKRIIKSAQYGMEPPAQELGDAISARWKELNEKYRPLRLMPSKLDKLKPFNIIKVEFEGNQDGITQEWFVYNNEALGKYEAYQNDEYENIHSPFQMFSKCHKYGYWASLDDVLTWLRKFA